MSYSYEQQKKKGSKKSSAETFVSGENESFLPNSAMVENLGHQVDMPVVMREKMEGAFGMDLSGVKLYENKAVGKAGAEAVTQGSDIAFAPGKMDFTSTHGQALLGHEISHVASQARGEVPGSGLVNDPALEARADREGLMAARGESVSPGFGGASAALSNASAASAAGPMQAKSGKKKKNIDNDDDIPEYNQEDFYKNGIVTGNNNTGGRDYSAAPEVKERGFFGTIYDWFSTVNSHINNTSDDLKELRRLREQDEMQSMLIFDDTEMDKDVAIDDENIADEVAHVSTYPVNQSDNNNTLNNNNDWVVLNNDNVNKSDENLIKNVDTMHNKKLFNE